MKCSLLAFLGLCLAAPASASTLYDNGPIFPSEGGLNINAGYFTSDSFTLSSASILTAAQVGIFVPTGNVPSAVSWQFGSTEGASDLGSGRSIFSTNSLVASLGGYDIYQSDFPLVGSLSAGSYWFSLDNGADTLGGLMYWAVSDGPSTVFFSAGYACPPLETCSESFQIYGNAGTSTPEPSSLLLLGSGLLGFGGYVRRRLAR